MTTDTVTPIALPEDFPEALAPLLQAGLDQLHAEQREEERQQAAERAAAEQAYADHWTALVCAVGVNLGSHLAAWVDWTPSTSWTARRDEWTARVQLPGCVPIDTRFVYVPPVGDNMAGWSRLAWTGKGLWRLHNPDGVVYTDDLGRALALARLYQLQADEAQQEPDDESTPF